jgi:DNA-binding XRE family transcriptional regulator
MDEGTKKLGQRLQLAREARRPRLTQPEAALQTGLGRTTVQNIEAGKFAKVNAGVRKYARFLGFEDGEAERIAAGEPEAREEEAALSQPDQLPLPPAVEYELRQSETLDATVITLGPEEADGHVIVVLQGKKGASPEEMRRIAARYRKVRRYVQNLANEDDEVADD